MGQAKKQYELLQLEKNDLPEDYTCAGHFDDYAIRKFIDDCDEIGHCSYCREKTKIALLKDVNYFIKGGVFAFYGHPDDEGVGYDSSEGGYQGASIFDTDDMFEDANLSIDDDKLYKDIYRTFGLNNWCERDPYDDRENVELNFKWENFKKAVKNQTPHIFQDPKRTKIDYDDSSVEWTLNDISLRVDELNLFKWLEPQTVFHRCRQHTNLETLNTASLLASPPDHFATQPNRMSPAGVSMFYCAFDKLTCHAETIDRLDTSQPLVTTGVFKNKDRLYLLDLTNLPDLPSKFDPEKRKHFYSILFLYNFVNDLSKPIDRGAPKEIDYLPTQIVTHFFRYTYEEYTGACIDGILYPSSKTKNTNACVLFFDHQQSLDALEFDATLLVIDKI